MENMQVKRIYKLNEAISSKIWIKPKEIKVINVFLSLYILSLKRCYLK